MTKIFYFSGSGHSFAVAEVFAGILSCETIEITEKTPKPSQEELAVLIFPVYCENIPEPVKRFLPDVSAKYIVLIATYGGVSYGNVLHEAQKLVQGTVIAGAYIPIGHTFLNGDSAFDTTCLLPVAERIQNPKPIQIPQSPKNIFSDLFPGFRSRISVQITKNDLCNDCGVCAERCPMHAIKDGKVTSKCIRCLRCVTNCPQGALLYKNRCILSKYLSRYGNQDMYRLYL